MKICSVCKRCFDDTAERCVDAGHPPLSVSRKGDPLMVPGYTLERLATSATKVDIYLARRLDCGRNCIVKIVSADAQNREDLVHDAQIAAMVFDPRLVDIFESGRLPERESFVVEEDVEGQKTLRHHLSELGAPDLLTSIRIVEQIAETLHVLHTSGLTHGAVRPENIVLYYAPDGLPKVKLCGIDLGGVIARNTIANKFLIDAAIDAIRYFAPEQCSGQPLSPQTDVYSLGVVFYELLAGFPPFDAPKATALIEMHRSHRPAVITIEDFELRMLVTHSLSESLQKQPSFRQSSADLFARQMRHIEQLATHVSTPPPAVGSPAAPPKITPSPIVFNTAPVSPPTAEPMVIEEYPRSYEDLAKPIRSYEPDPVSESVETEACAAAEESFPTHEAEFQADPGFQPPSAILTAADESLPPSGPEYIIELPLPERSSLAERRHRLKLWMKETHPLQPVNRDEVTEDAVLAPAYESVEEPPAIPGIAAVAHAFIEGLQPETTVKPKLIEWDQPDDIPSIGETETEALLEFEPAGDTSAATAPIARPELPIAPAAPPHVIEWELPEDDIPSIEDVIEARMSEEAPVVRAIQFKPEDFEVAAAVQERIEAGSKSSDPTPVAVVKNEARAAEAPRFEFVPTLLDGAKQRSKPEPRRDYSSIFTSYDAVDTPPRAFPYRSMFIGLGLMIIAAILGLGGDPLWRYFSESEPSRPVATTTAPVPAGPLPARSDRSTDAELPASEIEPPNSVSNSEPVEEGPEHITAKRPTTAAPAAPKTRRAAQTSAPASEQPERSSTNTPFAPSTVVITYGSGNVRRGDTQKERPANSSSRSDAQSRSGATRPRIVQDPPNR